MMVQFCWSLYARAEEDQEEFFRGFFRLNFAQPEGEGFPRCGTQYTLGIEAVTVLAMSRLYIQMII